MKTVEEIRRAVARLRPEEQYELFRWWVSSGGFRVRQFAVFKRHIAAGLEDLESGRYLTYDDSDIMRLAKSVSRGARDRLKKKRKGV